MTEAETIAAGLSEAMARAGKEIGREMDRVATSPEMAALLRGLGQSRAEFEDAVRAILEKESQ